MHDRIKVSVIITTFNRSYYLQGAVESVLKQDFKDFELIVVDDASVNQTNEKIIFSYKDPRIRYVRNEKNLGSAKSLNIGLGLAKGEYIAILDDDDVWISNEKMKRQVEFLDNHKDYVLVGTRIIVINYKNNNEKCRSHLSGGDAAIRKIILLRNPFAHSSVMFRKKAAVEVGGYDETLPRAKDYDLCLKLAKIGKVEILKNYDLQYRDASMQERNLVVQRFEDARWTLRVIKHHCRNFPNGSLAYCRQWLRYFVFRMLRLAPIFYKTYKDWKDDKSTK